MLNIDKLLKKYMIFAKKWCFLKYFSCLRVFPASSIRLAAEVMEYRKQHGKFPENLPFLPEIPLSKLDHKPLMYEKTENSFRIFSNSGKWQKPDTANTAFSYRISLPDSSHNF